MVFNPFESGEVGWIKFLGYVCGALARFADRLIASQAACAPVGSSIKTLTFQGVTLILKP